MRRHVGVIASVIAGDDGRATWVDSVGSAPTAELPGPRSERG